MHAKLITRNLRANRNAAHYAKQDGIGRAMHCLAWGMPMDYRGSKKLAVFVRAGRSGPNRHYGYLIRYLPKEA